MAELSSCTDIRTRLDNRSRFQKSCRVEAVRQKICGSLGCALYSQALYVRLLDVMLCFCHGEADCACSLAWYMAAVGALILSWRAASAAFINTSWRAVDEHFWRPVCSCIG